MYRDWGGLQIEQLQAGKRSLDRVLEAKDLELQAAHSRVKETLVSTPWLPDRCVGLICISQASVPLTCGLCVH